MQAASRLGVGLYLPLLFKFLLFNTTANLKWGWKTESEGN